ncbi:diguanylate cyclase [Vibrio sinensis]|uniref:Diguanylate cyclase n=1 Tax=Vibrio sinensis TaxID=2302434 RepID=A0A3A6Q9C3_9VIBR|nr:diguanylate cyclase [Vibrio sinensis]RJX68426.1 diguanylate cyclase [Vibrio sinensis]
MKKLFNSLPVRRKLQLIGMVTMLLGIVLSTTIIIRGNAEFAKVYVVDGLNTQANIIADNSAMALHFEDAKTGSEILMALQASPLVRAAKLIDNEQKVFADYRGYAIDTSYQQLTIDVVLDGDKLGSLVLFYDLSPFHNQLWRQAFQGTLIGLLVLMLAMLAQRRLLKHIADPIAALSQLVSNVGRSQNYSLRSKIQRSDELGKLATGLDTMLERIERYHLDEQLRAANKLSESESRYNTLVESVPVGVLQFDENGNCNFANRMLWQVIRRPIGEYQQLQLAQLACKSYQDAVTNMLTQTLNGQVMEPLEFCMQDGDSSIWLALDMNPLYTADDQINGAVGTILDITERKRHEIDLRLAASVFEASNDAIVITNAEGLIVSTNQAFSRITQYSELDALGKKPSILASSNTPHGLYQEMWLELKNHGRWNGELINRRKDGELYYAWLSIAAVKNQANEIINYVGISRDITDVKQENERIQYLAHYDGLTGLPNRTLFYDRANIEIARARRDTTSFALMFIDLDRFKWVNDTLGHSVGDALLIEVANRLSEVTRANDTVSRFGGDEFVLLITNVTSEKAYKVAVTLLEHLSGEAWCLGHSVTITPSIGISMWSSGIDDIDTLVKQADDAMYHAKRAGRNCIRYFQTELSA